MIKIVNVDYSWPLDAGVMRSLNNRQHTIPEYIEDCWKLCIGLRKKIDFTVIHICYNHFMKMVGKDIDEHNAAVAIKLLLMQCMRLACRCKKIEILIELFLLMVVVFSSKTKSSFFLSSLEKLESKISQNIDKNVLFEIMDYVEIGNYKKHNPKKDDRIFLDSPFYEKFNKVYKNVMKRVQHHDENR